MLGLSQQENKILSTLTPWKFTVQPVCVGVKCDKKEIKNLEKWMNGWNKLYDVNNYLSNYSIMH
jgi:hypothetical protein